MKKTLCILIAMLAFIASCVIVPNSASATPTQYYLSVPIIPQPKTNWCWAACGASVVAFMTNDFITPYDFSQTVMGNTVNNSTATLTQVVSGLNSYGLYATQYSNYISFSTIISQIGNNQRPILARLEYYDLYGNYIGGHLVEIRGYHNETSSQTVSFMDPLYTNYRNMSYNSFKHTGDHYWTHTIHNIHS